MNEQKGDNPFRHLLDQAKGFDLQVDPAPDGWDALGAAARSALHEIRRLLTGRDNQAGWVRVNPGLSLVTLLLLGGVGMIGVKLSAEQPLQAPSAPSIGRSLAPSEPTSTRVAVVDSPPVDSEYHQLQRYLDDYIKNGLARDFTTTASKKWVVVNAPPFVVKKVTKLRGINQTDFPDTLASEEIPNEGRGGVKSWPSGTSVPGIFSKLVVEINESNGKVQVWTARFSDKGGFSFRKKPFPEFSRVADSEDIEGEFAKFQVEGEDGSIKDVTVQELLTMSYPQIGLPPYAGVPGVVK